MAESRWMTSTGTSNRPKSRHAASRRTPAIRVPSESTNGMEQANLADRARKPGDVTEITPVPFAADDAVDREQERRCREGLRGTHDSAPQLC